MPNHYNIRNKELAFSQHQRIERWHNKEKLINRHIAHLLGRSPQTVSNEVRIGFVQLKTKSKYSAKQAQEIYGINKKSVTVSQN